MVQNMKHIEKWIKYINAKIVGQGEGREKTDKWIRNDLNIKHFNKEKSI